MRRFIGILLVGLVSAGCNTTPAIPGATAPPTPADVPTVTSPPEPVAGVPAPNSLKEPQLITIDHAALAPYFQATSSSFQGIFLVQGEDLYYVKDGARVHVLKGAHPLNGAQPRALAAGSQGVIVSDGAKLFWFTPAASQLAEIPDAPPAVSVAARGDTYLIAGNKSVVRWTPGTAPVELAKPDVLFSVYGVTLSPDGR